MAVFLINICKFNGCGITFPSLGDLIKHIEYTHIDNDPKIVEQRERAPPACVPLSYVLRFLSDDAPKEMPIGINASNLSNHNATSSISTTNSAVTATANNSGGIINNNNNSIISNNNNNSISTTGNDLKRKMAIKHHSYSMSSSNRSNTPTGSEMDEDEMMVTESEDSNESWTTEEFSSEFIMRHSMNGASNGTPGNEKPFACPVPGCKKRYKNVNGIKYHSKNGHKKDGKVRKGYKCHCGKSYKTAQGLKNHALGAHNSMPDSSGIASSGANSNSVAGIGVHHVTGGSVLSTSTANGGVGGSIMMQQRSTSPSQQSLGSLSPSSISNMSSSASSCHGSSSIVGANNTHAITANLVLQQLTNGGAGTGSGSGNNSITTSAATIIAANQHHHHQPQQQQQHQQQFTITTTGNNNNNNSQMHNGLGNSSALNATSDNNTTLKLINGSPAAVATAAAITMPTSQASSSTSPSLATANDNAVAAKRVQQPQVSPTPMTVNANLLNANNNNNNNKNNIVSTTATATTTITNTYQQRPVVAVNKFSPSSTASTTPSTETINRPISPRFIEHKCSVNLFKEKFLANLRNNQDLNKTQLKSFPNQSNNNNINGINKVNNGNSAGVLGIRESGTKDELVQAGSGGGVDDLPIATAVVGPKEPVLNSKGFNNIENSIPDSFVVQKHLNANFQNAIYTKTVN